MPEQKHSQSSSLYEKRKKIHVKEVEGLYQRLRDYFLTISLTLFFVGPWLMWNSHQAILFDLPRRNFHIFGLTFWPQDFILLVGLLVTAAFSLIFITTLAGRVWCGYACPQTVWTKLFMEIERLTEGTRSARIRLDQQNFTLAKVVRRGIKYLLWLIIAWATAMTFVGYFTPIRQLILAFFHLNFNIWETLFIVLFTVMTYLNAGFMREQVCLYMCPYARFQSAMFDNQSLIISYDTKRGEPRGSRKKGTDPQSLGLGSCIDCQQCIQVCPTGIDIRQGLQIACIGCAACVDMCNQVMDKMNYPRGLIRYSTEEVDLGHKLKIARPRLVANAAILLMIVFALVVGFVTRVPLRLDIIKERTRLYTMTSSGEVRNDYLLKIINMSQQPHTYKITVLSPIAINYRGKKEVTIGANQLLSLPVSVTTAPHQNKINVPITFTVTNTDDPKQQVSHENRFILPQ